MAKNELTTAWLQTGYKVAAAVDMVIGVWFVPEGGIIDLLWKPAIDAPLSSYGFRPASVTDKVSELVLEEDEHILDAFLRLSGQPTGFFDLVH